MIKFVKPEGIRFGGWAIDENEWDILQKYMEENNVMSVVEFGAGVSTYLFSQCLKHLAYEIHEPTITQHADKLILRRDLRKPLTAQQIVDDIFLAGVARFDLAFVDSPSNTGGKLDIRKYSVQAAMQMTDNIIMHDTIRPGEQKIINDNLADWYRFDFESKRGMTLFSKNPIRKKRNVTRKIKRKAW